MGTTRRPAAAKKPAAKKPTAAELKRRADQAKAARSEQEIPLENGVVVWRVETPPGSDNFTFVVQCIGDVKPTEITDTLLYGVKVNREQRGLD